MTTTRTFTCFLLNYGFRDFRGHFEITLYALAGDHTPAKIVIDNFHPLFFIPSTTNSGFTTKALQRKTLPLKAMDNNAVDCLYFSAYSSYLDCAREFRNLDIRVYESDVHPVDRYLMERFVAGGFEANGPYIMVDKTLVMHNPQIRGCEVKPALKVMSIDIETNASTGRLYSIACDGEDKAVFIIGDTGKDHSISAIMKKNSCLNFSVIFASRIRIYLLDGMLLISTSRPYKPDVMHCRSLSTQAEKAAPESFRASPVNSAWPGYPEEW